MSKETSFGETLTRGTARRRQRTTGVRLRASDQIHDRMLVARRQLVSLISQRHTKRGVDINESL